jgi:hypothetical protein
MKLLGYKVLLVYPNNNQVKDMNTLEGIDAVTLNTFFSMGVTEEQRMKKFDDSEYDCIVFDEIFNHNVYGLRYIRKYILDNTEKIILGAGDIHQLEAVELSTNNKDNDEYITDCINQMFPHFIKFSEIKRNKNPEQVKILIEMYNDILFSNISVTEIIKKYIINVLDEKEYIKLLQKGSCSNIAFTNERCKTVNRMVRKAQGKSDDYEVGDHIRCIQRFNVSIKTDKDKDGGVLELLEKILRKF